MERGFEVDLRELSVQVGFPCGASIPWQTGMALARTAHACAQRGVPFDVNVVYGSSVVTTARSLVAHHFLQSASSRLFWIDSDVDWAVSDFLRLLALSKQHDVVCATYPLKRDEPGHTSFVIKTPSNAQYDVSPEGLLKVEGVGLGFTCVSRYAMQALADTKREVLNQPTDELIKDMFRIDTIDGRVRGEDMAFFADLQALGFDAWLDPTLQIGHVGPKVWRGDPVAGLGLTQYYPEAV